METGSLNPYMLHVEDDDGDAYLVTRALAQSRCNVRIGRTTDGKEAISLLTDVGEGRFERPSLILIDLKLPLVSGLGVLEFLRSSSKIKDIPAVMFTSSDLEKDMEAAREAGCDDYFVKPIDYIQFRRVVSEICEKYLSPVRSADPSVKALVL